MIKVFGKYKPIACIAMGITAGNVWKIGLDMNSYMIGFLVGVFLIFGIFMID
jgi:hypothetical protein